MVIQHMCQYDTSQAEIMLHNLMPMKDNFWVTGFFLKGLL